MGKKDNSDASISGPLLIAFQDPDERTALDDFLQNSALVIISVGVTHEPVAALEGEDEEAVANLEPVLLFIILDVIREERGGRVQGR